MRGPRAPHQVLWHDPRRGRPQGRRGRRLGAGRDPVARLGARVPPRRRRADRQRGAPAGRAGGRVRQPAARRGRAPGDDDPAVDDPAPRRGGPAVLRRDRAAHRRQGHQGRARALRRGRPGARHVPQRRLPPARHVPGRRPRRHRRDVRLGADPPAAVREDPADPQRRPDARERRRRDRRHAPVRRRRRQRRGVRARHQGPRPPPGVRRRRARVRPGGRRGVTVERTSSLEHRFGPYGGQYVPETLMPALGELEVAWGEAQDDPTFRDELAVLLRDFVGRPSPLYLSRGISRAAGRPVYLKREDLNHTGAHKINNAIGQALLARRMGKDRIIAETGAGQHGVATATACALLGLRCIVYMGVEDMRRQRPNVLRMQLLGTTVEPVDAGARTLKEAVSAAIRDWVANVGDTHYVIGSCVGPAPFPALVRDLQRVIGDEARAQLREVIGRLPDRVVACVGGGSNAIGTFVPFVADDGVALVGVEAAGDGIDTGRHGAPLTVGGRGGVLHGAYSAIMQDEDGQILEAHSISAGLDYPGTGPEHAHLRDTGRATYVAITDEEALATLRRGAPPGGGVPAPAAPPAPPRG